MSQLLMPGLAQAIKEYDAEHFKRLSEDEIAKRQVRDEFFKEHSAALLNLPIPYTRDDLDKIGIETFRQWATLIKE